MRFRWRQKHQFEDICRKSYYCTLLKFWDHCTMLEFWDQLYFQEQSYREKMNAIIHWLVLIHYLNFSLYLLALILVSSIKSRKFLIKSCNGFYQIIKILLIHCVPWFSFSHIFRRAVRIQANIYDGELCNNNYCCKFLHLRCLLWSCLSLWFSWYICCRISNVTRKYWHVTLTALDILIWNLYDTKKKKNCFF